MDHLKNKIKIKLKVEESIFAKLSQVWHMTTIVSKHMMINNSQVSFVNHNSAEGVQKMIIVKQI